MQPAAATALRAAVLGGEWGGALGLLPALAQGDPEVLRGARYGGIAMFCIHFKFTVSGRLILPDHQMWLSLTFLGSVLMIR